MRPRHEPGHKMLNVYNNLYNVLIQAKIIIYTYWKFAKKNTFKILTKMANHKYYERTLNIYLKMTPALVCIAPHTREERQPIRRRYHSGEFIFSRRSMTDLDDVFTC